MLPLTNHSIIEGKDLSIMCNATPGNPSKSMFFWTKDPTFRQNGSTLQLPKIKRNSSGSYRCTVENSYSIGGKGSDKKDMTIVVFCKY